MTLFIIQCTKSKKQYSCSAIEMYSSSKFDKILNLIQQIPDVKIKIFSAKYGLINLNDIIEPYSCTLEPYPPGYTARYTKEEIFLHRKMAKESQIKILPVLDKQIKILEEIPYLILSKAYQDCYEKAGGKYILNLQHKCGGTFFIFNTVETKLLEMKLISNNSLFDF